MHDLEIRPERRTETEEIRDVVTAAFGRRDEADIVAALRESPEFRPNLSLVAHRERDVVGHVTFADVTLADDPDRNALVLAPLAVAPDHQRSGVGSELVRVGLDRAREAGDELVFLHGDPDYYGRFGFTTAGDAGFENPIDLPDEDFQVFDRSGDAVGDTGGTLVYPDPLLE